MNYKLLLIIIFNLTLQLKAENETKATLNFLSKIMAATVSYMTFSLLDEKKVKNLFESLDKNFFIKQCNESNEIYEFKSIFVCPSIRILFTILAGLVTYDILKTR